MQCFHFHGHREIHYLTISSNIVLTIMKHAAYRINLTIQLEIINMLSFCETSDISLMQHSFRRFSLAISCALSVLLTLACRQSPRDMIARDIIVLAFINDVYKCLIFISVVIIQRR